MPTAGLAHTAIIALLLASLTLASCGNVLSGIAEEDSAVGDGTEANPYRIRTAEQLNAIRGGVEGYEEWDLADHYRLMADIDLSSYANWTPIGTYTSPTVHSGFSGTLDGNGFEIKNLVISASSRCQGFFTCIESAGTVHDLGLTAVNVTSSSGDYIGGLAGRSYGTISDCRVTGAVTGSGMFVGGLAGQSYGGTVSGCRSAGTIVGSSYVGGLMGSNYLGNLCNCASSATVSGTSYIGGLMGSHFEGDASGCHATGTVSGSDHVGGFAGSITSLSNVYSNVTDCYSTGNVNGTGDYVGGFVGYASSDNTSTISGCRSTGNTTGQAGYVGGFAGHNEKTTISGCLSTGTVTVGTYYAGGFVGENLGTISRCISAGSVSGGSECMGGFAGSNDGGTIAECFSSGSVSGSSACVGGFVGSNSSSDANTMTLQNCYAIGAASCTSGSYVGGLVGRNFSSISDCYSTGVPSGASFVGGLLGASESGTITNCFYNSTTSGCTDSDRGTPKTTVEMKTQATFSGWDFSATWGIDEGTSYPSLLWQK